MTSQHQDLRTSASNADGVRTLELEFMLHDPVKEAADDFFVEVARAVARPTYYCDLQKAVYQRVDMVVGMRVDSAGQHRLGPFA